MAARLRLDGLRLPVHRARSIRRGRSRSRLRLLDLGVDEVCFGDTIGVGVPSQVGDARPAGPSTPASRSERIAFHFHDTRGTALANVAAGLDAGVRCFDSSAGGTGGCPYAPGAAGNLATEDLVYLLDAAGTEHGVVARGVLDAARFIADALGRPLASKVGQAGGWDPATGQRPARLDVAGAGPARTRPSVSDVLLSSRPMDGVVLVLNQNYEPLNVCNLPRAFRLVFGEKAEVIEYDHQVIRTPRTEYRAPVRDPAPVPDPPAAAAGQADAPRGLRPRPAHLPVLRSPDPRPDPRPHRPAPSRRRTHVGEPRHRLQGAATTARAARRSRRPASGCQRPPFEPRSDIYSLFTPYLADERNEAWRTYLFLGRN